MTSRVKKSDIRVTTDEWRRLGKDDPLFAVAAHEDRRGSWEPDDFYQLGKDDWEDFSRFWRDYQPELGGSVIEVGCGAGRMTKQLLHDFDRVIGLDVSSEMIALAAQAAPTAEFHVVDGIHVPVPDGSVDAVFTCHVLQHLENLDVIAAYLTNLRRALRPGGTIMAHLLLAEEQRGVARKGWSELKLRAIRLRRANVGAYSRVRSYRPDEVRTAMESTGFRDVEMREFRVRSNDSVHAFWFGATEL